MRVVVFVCISLLAKVALATNYSVLVDTTADSPNTSGCELLAQTTKPSPFGAPCSLRGAINLANSTLDVGTDMFRIWFLDGLGTISIEVQPLGQPRSSERGENANAFGDFDVINMGGSINLRFEGNGPAATVIDGGGLDRVFDIHPNQIVIFANMTIQGGRTNIPQPRNNFDLNAGGAGVFVHGTVVQNNTTHFDNVVLQNNVVPALNATACNAVVCDQHWNASDCTCNPAVNAGCLLVPLVGCSDVNSCVRENPPCTPGDTAVGGAIGVIENATVFFAGTIRNNQSHAGGAFFFGGGTRGFISGSRLENNIATGNGGVMISYADLLISSTEIVQNDLSRTALLTQGGCLRLYNTAFSGVSSQALSVSSTSACYPGPNGITGIPGSSGVSTIIANTTFAKNTVQSSVLDLDGPTLIVNSTFADNTVNAGSVIDHDGASQLRISHTTIANNVGNSGLHSPGNSSIRLLSSVVAQNRTPAGTLQNCLFFGPLTGATASFTDGLCSGVSDAEVRLGGLIASTAVGATFVQAMSELEGSATIDVPATATTCDDSALVYRAFYGVAGATYDQRNRARPSPNPGACDAGSFEARTFLVTTTGDTGDASIDGICNAVGGGCTLRAALQEANADAGAIIVFDTPVLTIALTAPLPQITASVSIGRADSLLTTIDATAAGGAPALDFQLDAAEYGDVSDIKIVNANNPGSGGAIQFKGKRFTLSNCEIAHNRAFNGGGVYVDANSATISYCTIGNNDANAAGGAVYLANGSLTTTNVTMMNNTAATDGGGLYILGTSAVSLTHNTIAANTAVQNGGNLFSNTNAQLINSIIANGTAASGDDCWGAVVTLASSTSIIADTAGCSVSGVGNILNVDPILGSLRNNWGSVRTAALLDGSPALDATSIYCPADDARRFKRPNGPACDLGAYERVDTDLTLTAPVFAATIPVGQAFSTTLTLTNAGPNPASDVVVTIAIPANVTAPTGSFSGYPCSVVGTNLVCPLNNLANGGSISGTVSFTPALIGMLSFQASADSNELDTAANHQVAATLQVVGPDLNLTSNLMAYPGSLSVGESFTDSLWIANVGNATATGITLRYAIAANASVITASVTTTTGVFIRACTIGVALVTCVVDDVAPADAGFFVELEVTATAPGTLHHEPTVSASVSEAAANNSESADISVGQVDLALGLSGPTQPQGFATYTISVSNAGPSTAHVVTTTITLPPGATALPNADCTGSTTLTCSFGDVLFGASDSISLTITFTQGGTLVAATNTSDSDTVAGNDTASLVIAPVITQTAGVTVAGGSVVDATTATLTINVTNDGAATTNGSASATFPEGATPTSANVGGTPCLIMGQVVTCTIDGLAGGSTAVITVVATAPVNGSYVVSTTVTTPGETEMGTIEFVVSASGSGMSTGEGEAETGTDPDSLRLSGLRTQGGFYKCSSSGAAGAWTYLFIALWLLARAGSASRAKAAKRSEPPTKK